MAEIMESLSELRTTMISIQNDLENPEKLLPPEYLRQVSNKQINYRNEKILDLINEIEDIRSAMSNTVELDDSVDVEHLEDLIEYLHHHIRELRNEIVHREKRISHLPTKDLSDF